MRKMSKIKTFVLKTSLYPNPRSDIPLLFPYFIVSHYAHHTHNERGLEHSVNSKMWETLGLPSKLPTTAIVVSLLLAAVSPASLKDSVRTSCDIVAS